jgi:predicted peroxiredoxin
VVRSLVVKLTAGTSEPERANQAFTVAASAVAMGATVSLWLTGDAAWFAVPGRADDLGLPLATPLAQLRSAVLDGGTITLCSQCAARREITGSDVFAGVVVAGAASFAAEVLEPDVQALVY